MRVSNLTVSSTGSSSSKPTEVRSSKPRTSTPATGSSSTSSKPASTASKPAATTTPASTTTVSAAQRLERSNISSAPTSRVIPISDEIQPLRDDVQLSSDVSREETDFGRYEQLKNLTGSLTQSTVSKISSPPPAIARRDEAQGIESTSRTSQASKVKTQLLDNSLPLTSTSASDSQTRWKLNYPNQSTTASNPPKPNTSTSNSPNPGSSPTNQLPAANPRAAAPLDPLSGSSNSGLWSKDPAWQGLMPKQGSPAEGPGATRTAGDVGHAVSSAVEGVKNTVNNPSKGVAGATEGAITSAASSVKDSLLKPLATDSKASPDTRFPGDPKQASSPDGLGGLSKTLDTKGIADKILGKLPAFGGFGANKGAPDTNPAPSAQAASPSRPKSEPTGKQSNQPPQSQTNLAPAKKSTQAGVSPGQKAPAPTQASGSPANTRPAAPAETRLTQTQPKLEPTISKNAKQEDLSVRSAGPGRAAAPGQPAPIIEKSKVPAAQPKSQAPASPRPETQEVAKSDSKGGLLGSLAKVGKEIGSALTGGQTPVGTGQATQPPIRNQETRTASQPGANQNPQPNQDAGRVRANQPAADAGRIEGSKTGAPAQPKADPIEAKPQTKESPKSESKGGLFGSLAKIGQDIGKAAGDAVKSVGDVAGKVGGEISKGAGEVARSLPGIGELPGLLGKTTPEKNPVKPGKPAADPGGRTQPGVKTQEPKLAPNPKVDPGRNQGGTNQPQDPNRPQQGGGETGRNRQVDPNRPGNQPADPGRNQGGTNQPQDPNRPQQGGETGRNRQVDPNRPGKLSH
ncbi:MAG: hypothetical protein U0931_05290 [Vulcanimicrobiota bacterium]